MNMLCVIFYINSYDKINNTQKKLFLDWHGPGVTKAYGQHEGNHQMENDKDMLRPEITAIKLPWRNESKNNPILITENVLFSDQYVNTWS